MPEDIINKSIAIMERMPYETTSSMHSDFENKKPHTELISLTGYVVREANKHVIASPTYDKIYTVLS